MKYSGFAKPAMILTVAIGWIACGKDERIPDAAKSGERKADADGSHGG